MGAKSLREIKAALTKKGFVEHHAHHNYFYLHNADGSVTNIYTYFSHGKKEYGDGLLKATSENQHFCHHSISKTVAILPKSEKNKWFSEVT